MTNKILSALIILILIVAGVLLFMGRSVAPTESELDSGMPVPTEEGESVSERVVELTVDASNFEFSNKSISVEKGDTVKITVVNTSNLPHDLRIDELGVAVRLLNAGESDTVEFRANETGTFEFYCSVGNHKERGMVGQLIVN